MVPDKNVTLLAGDGATGKTLPAPQLFAAVSSRGQWLWRDIAHGPVVFLSAEDDIDELSRRLASRSQLSKALRKKFHWRRRRHTLKGRQTESKVERVGLRLQLRKQQAGAGDIVLLLR
jgi:AAA domain